jgi:hypothetical protein
LIWAGTGIAATAAQIPIACKRCNPFSKSLGLGKQYTRPAWREQRNTSNQVLHALEEIVSGLHSTTSNNDFLELCEVQTTTASA